MPNTVVCDRCHNDVEGYIDEGSGMSAGVYVGWDEYMKDGEHVICDACMWVDPRYIAIYGKHE